MVWRIVKGTVLLGVLGSVALGAVYRFCPGLWVKIERRVAGVTGWTEEARQADPVGFVEDARARLQKDLEAMRKTRADLAAEVDSLARKLAEQRTLRDRAQELAEEFRDRFHTVGLGESVVVRDAAYTKDQVKSQVSMLLAEAEGYEAAVARLEEVKREAEGQHQRLTVRINATESQLAVLSAQRELLQVRKLSDEGEKLLARVDELMHGNTKLLERNPVRNVRELLASPESKPEAVAEDSAVEEFLAAKPTPRAQSGGMEEDGAPEPEERAESEPAREPVATAAEEPAEMLAGIIAEPKEPVLPAASPAQVEKAAAEADGGKLPGEPPPPSKPVFQQF